MEAKYENLIILNKEDRTIEIVGEVSLGTFLEYIHQFFDENSDENMDEWWFDDIFEDINQN